MSKGKQPRPTAKVPKLVLVEKDVELHRQPGCWLRSSHTLKECVIAHWSSDSAPKIQRGSKRIPKLGLADYCRGRGASYERRSHSESGGGFHTSENAGMSSENYVRIIMAESLRF